MRHLSRSLFGLVLAAAVWLVPILAFGAAEADQTLSPYFFVDSDDPSVDQLPLKKTEVDVSISGVIAGVTVRQTYTNEGTRPINARYVFPASTRAAVHGMKMTIGEIVIVAQVKEKQKAQAEFDEAKRQGKSASLLKQHRPNVFSMNVANIMPGDRVDIELRYTELLVPTDSVYEFVYPTVVGPRYSNQTESEAGEDAEWVKNPYLKEGEKPTSEFHIRAQVAAGLPLQDVICDTHKVDVSFESDSVASVTLANAEAHGGNRDFILKYRLAGRQIESGLLLYEGEDESFFLLMVQPPHRVRAEHIPPREYIFVVDVSGSMNGFPLNTSKTLLRDLVGNLRPTDKFNVLFFAGGNRLLAPASLPANSRNIQKAIASIDDQRGGGGTELVPAMRRALELPRDEGTSRSIVVVTDGYVSADAETFTVIRENLGNANVFSFGIGSSVNRHLIEGMARAGMGEPFVVTGPNKAPSAAKRFRAYIEAPVLANVKVRYEGFEAYDVEPLYVPDLLAERPLVVHGKWRGRPSGTIEVTGVSGEGEYRKIFSVDSVVPQATNAPLKYLWARTRIANLSDFGLSGKEAVAAVTNLGLTYNLLTQYTSFVAVYDVVRNPGGKAKDVKQPLPLPKGVSNLAVGGSVAKVPEPGIWSVLAVALAVLGSMGLLRRRLQRIAVDRGL
jgi:Ca-activated chloride channel family protein